MNDVQEKMRQEEKNRLLKKHQYAIFYDEKDNRWKTTVLDETKKNGRRLIARRNKEKLINELVEYYAKIEDKEYIEEILPTIENIFPKWMKYKSSLTDATSYSKRLMTDWNKFYKGTEIVKIPVTDLNFITLNQ